MIVILAARQPPLRGCVPLLDRHLQPHLDQMQHLPIHDSPCHTLQKFGVRNRVKVLRQIRVHDIRISFVQQFIHFPDRILRPLLRPIPISIRLQVRFPDRFQHQFRGGLHHPVPYRRDPERPLSAPGFGIITRRTGCG